MAIRFGGINTGLPPNIVDQLIEVERMPARAMEVKKQKVDTKLKLVTDLETKLRGINTSLKELAGTKGFSDIQLLSADPSIITGVVDPELAQGGTWDVEVLELAGKAGAVSNGFPDKDQTEIGVGYFKFDTPDGTRDVYIHGGNNTLNGVVGAINSADVGVRASIINDQKNPEAPYKLLISADKVGDNNNVSYPTLYFLDGDQDIYFEDERASKNGKIKIDGFEFEIPSNTIEDLVPGVTLELRQAAPGRVINLSVKEDREVVSGKIKTFVDSVNEVLGFIQSQNKMDEKTDTSQTLGGDSLIRNIENQMRQLLQNSQYGIQGDIRSLGQMGIQFNRNGTLNFDEEKFNQVLAKKPNSVREFFVGDGFSTGFIAATRRTISSMVDGAFGPVANRKRGMTQEIEQIDRRIENVERQVANKEQNLRKKFANLEEKMSRLKSQGSFLAQRFGGGGQDFNLGGASGLGGAKNG